MAIISQILFSFQKNQFKSLQFVLLGRTDTHPLQSISSAPYPGPQWPTIAHKRRISCTKPALRAVGRSIPVHVRLSQTRTALYASWTPKQTLKLTICTKTHPEIILLIYNSVRQDEHDPKYQLYRLYVVRVPNSSLYPSSSSLSCLKTF